MRLDPTEFYFASLKINEDVAILAAALGLIMILVFRRRQPLLKDDEARVAERQREAVSTGAGETDGDGDGGDGDGDGDWRSKAD